MIQKTRLGRSGVATSEFDRIDGPAVLLPSHHFDVTDNRAIIKFLSHACELIGDRSTSFESMGRMIRQIYGVLRGKRKSCSQQAWQSFVEVCRHQPILPVLHQDEFSRRAFVKPRGYAGDAVLLDYIYGAEQFWSPPDMNWVGQRIHQWTTASSACQGVKARRGLIARTIDQLAIEKHQAEILSLAAGHLREAELSGAIIRRQLARVIAVDSDPQSLEQIDKDYGCFGIQTIHATARELLGGRFDLGTFDLIYSAGLLDYLNDGMCQRLISRLFERLKPGGKLLVSNFSEDIEGVGYMEAFMDWHLIYRDRADMIQMTMQLPDWHLGSVSLFSEENHNVMFMMIERAR